jgi:xanthine dehydrogenase YagR molybdenum-binding subunit
MQLRDDGTVRIACATQDIGTGTYTILAQLASEKTGVPFEKIEVELGDSSLPDGPISGGSLATSSLVPAVFKAADQAITSLLIVAVSTPDSPFFGRKPEDLALESGRIFVKADGVAKGVSFGDVLRRANARQVTGSGSAEQTVFVGSNKFSMHSFGCHFVEVTWQPETARLRVSRVVSVIDPQNGAPINSNLADYIMTVNLDAPPIEVHFLDHPDKEINELGARGIGEIGLAGIAAAITDAVHHATGVRVRELPVKIENLLV